MKKIIVGSRGFIASKLASRRDYIRTSRNPVGDELCLDLTKLSEFDFSVVDSDSLVLLLGAISSPDECRRNFDMAYQTNVIGTREFISRILERGARTIFFSSDVVLGEGRERMDERAPLRPMEPYAEMKAEIESSFRGRDNFKIMRLSYVLSAADRFFQYLLSCAEKGGRAEIFDPFDRGVVYLNDVLESIERLCDRWEDFGFDLVNVCGAELVSRQMIAEYFCAVSGGALQFDIVAPPEGFFANRPRVINTKSRFFTSLLGREQTSAFNAIKSEYAAAYLAAEQVA